MGATESAEPVHPQSPYLTANNMKVLRNTMLTSTLTHTKVVEYLTRVENEAEKKGDFLSLPEFPHELEWLNLSTSKLSLKKELRGKILLLDFWTFCCIK